LGRPGRGGRSQKWEVRSEKSGGGVERGRGSVRGRGRKEGELEGRLKEWERCEG